MLNPSRFLLMNATTARPRAAAGQNPYAAAGRPVTDQIGAATASALYRLPGSGTSTTTAITDSHHYMLETIYRKSIRRLVTMETIKKTMEGMIRREVRKLCLLGTILVLCVMCQNSAFAQSATTGSINGTIVDTSGAVVPGAFVTITDLATRDQRVVVSNAEGRFTVPFLKPDNFEVSATAQGLQSTKTTVQVLTS